MSVDPLPGKVKATNPAGTVSGNSRIDKVPLSPTSAVKYTVVQVDDPYPRSGADSGRVAGSGNGSGNGSKTGSGTGLGTC